MATRAPENFDAAELRGAIRLTYERVAREPRGEFHFHRGRAYAIDYLGYDAVELDAVPSIAVDRFAGVGNPLRIERIEPGQTVLDHACGAGLDLLLAARRVGDTGRAIGVDITPAMREVAQRAAREANLGARVEVRAGNYEDLPVETNSVDVVISNGVVNLAPDKRRVLDEVFRVLRPGGRFFLADVVVARELKLETRQRPELWAACIAGALPERELLPLTSEVGFVHQRTEGHFDCFAGTSAEHKVSRDLRVRSLNFFARKPSNPSSLG
ncbi:MAG TPA: methyltransferase domain-containing protein [Polyangiaceae bacterium]|nr:methyltransferase domain-containing protein [Polyangiaceae bacterium]